MSDGDPKTVVLVVDDNPETLAMLTAALEQIGALVLVATDGGGAMKAVSRIVPVSTWIITCARVGQTCNTLIQKRTRNSLHM